MKSTWVFALLVTLGLAFGSQLLAQESVINLDETPAPEDPVPAETYPASPAEAYPAEEATAPAENPAPAVEEAAPAYSYPAAATEEAAPAEEAVATVAEPSTVESLHDTYDKYRFIVIAGAISVLTISIFIGLTVGFFIGFVMGYIFITRNKKYTDSVQKKSDN